MYKFFLIFTLTIFLNVKPLFSQNNNFNMNIKTAFTSNNTLGFYNNLRAQNKSNINFNLEYSKNNFSSQLNFNFDDHDKFNFDNTFANYKIGIANINIGKINRIWSFSKKSSLILSSNSRPLEAISIKLENKFDTKWLSSDAKWSIEAINGSTKNSHNGKNSMLFGARAVISPSERLSFEILQTSQWGGKTNRLRKSTLSAILLNDTNSGEYAEINKMAGFGLSYTIPTNKNTYRVYGQAIGEDEAGSLPSCYSWIAGLELLAPNIKAPTKLAIEVIDTRTDTSTNGWCGPNIVYNNHTYDYVNYGTVMGVPVDTEGTSLELFGQSYINKNLTIDYSAQFLAINDNDYLYHRLSSNRSTGSIISLGMSWKQNTFNLSGNISYQNLTLDKAKIAHGTIFGLTSSIDF